MLAQNADNPTQWDDEFDNIAFSFSSYGFANFPLKFLL